MKSDRRILNDTGVPPLPQQMGSVTAQRLEDQPVIAAALSLYPRGKRTVQAGSWKLMRVPADSAYPDAANKALNHLGLSKWDTPATVEKAYDLQSACDVVNSPRWLGALESIANQPKYGKENLLVKVVTERSLDKHTEG